MIARQKLATVPRSKRLEMHGDTERCQLRLSNPAATKEQLFIGGRREVPDGTSREKCSHKMPVAIFHAPHDTQVAAPAAGNFRKASV